MTEVEVIKYYAHGKEYDPIMAQLKLDKLRAKNPNREYTILVNMRAYAGRYSVVQVEKILVELADEADLLLPPLERPTGSWQTNGQAWEDYRHERGRRTEMLAKMNENASKMLRRSLPK